ncbi:spore germination protein GerPE [uncultured Metabacillus sp.]|uniref:spore germination protein GerPE n=1 Tax=uncultured Metabacillus sp. TaxID=2860135 RepID=UPI002623BD51|nr:spore germination protein GerPE [uncultured Metabacillus sp.]
MISRFSNVNRAYVNTVGISSVFNIGDSMQITPLIKVLAIQREQEIYYDEEGKFSQFPIFEEEIPQPVFYEQLTTNFFNKNPKINVDSISVTSISSSAILQIGSTKDIVCESRTKHIRQSKN